MASWGNYFAQRDGHPVSVFLDLDFRKTAPDRARPLLCRVRLAMRAPRADGLSDGAEAGTLHQIEDALCERLAAQADAVLVGRITGGGAREFCFYARAGAQPAAHVDAVVAGFTGYQHTTRSAPDPDWTHYCEQLYPDDDQLQCMNNLKVLEALRERGDVLEVPRPVRHWALFPDQVTRDKFVARMAPDGFATESATGPDPGQALPFAVCLLRTHTPLPGDVDPITLALRRAARDFGGEYDGWESPVMSAQDAAPPEPPRPRKPWWKLW